jgi:hypothetical protein
MMHFKQRRTRGPEHWWIFPFYAPRDASWIEAKLYTGEIIQVHFASDLSGEEQPPFEGWFKDAGSYFSEVDVKEIELWRRLGCSWDRVA